MDGWRRRLATAPLAVHFAYFTAVFGLLTWLLDRLVGEDRSSTGRLVGVLFYGGCMTAFTAWQRRRRGGRGRTAELAAALRSGALPGDADPAVWGPLLERERRSNETAPPVALMLFGLGAAISLAFALTTDRTWWLLVVLYTALVVVVPMSSRRTVRRVDRLRRRLDSGSPVG